MRFRTTKLRTKVWPTVQLAAHVRELTQNEGAAKGASGARKCVVAFLAASPVGTPFV